MTHPPSCPARGGAQLQAWTPGRPSLVLSTSLFPLRLGSRTERHVRLCVVAGKWFCLEPTTQPNKRAPQDLLLGVVGVPGLCYRSLRTAWNPNPKPGPEL